MERFDASSIEAVRETVNSFCKEDTKSRLNEFIQWCKSRSDEEKIIWKSFFRNSWLPLIRSMENSKLHPLKQSFLHAHYSLKKGLCPPEGRHRIRV